MGPNSLLQHTEGGLGISCKEIAKIGESKRHMTFAECRSGSWAYVCGSNGFYDLFLPELGKGDERSYFFSDQLDTYDDVMVGCCHRRAPSQVSSVGMIFSGTSVNDFLVSDIDWKCEWNDVPKDLCSKPQSYYSGWQNAYIIESNSGNDNISYENKSFDFDDRYDPSAKWIWVEKRESSISNRDHFNRYSQKIEFLLQDMMDCAHCKARLVNKHPDFPTRSLLGLNISYDLAESGRLIQMFGTSHRYFSFVFELYIRHSSHNTAVIKPVQTISCAGAQLILVPCKRIAKEWFVIHLGINGSKQSEIR